jgi:hypothetical protein
VTLLHRAIVRGVSSRSGATGAAFALRF